MTLAHNKVMARETTTEPDARVRSSQKHLLLPKDSADWRLLKDKALKTEEELHVKKELSGSSQSQNNYNNFTRTWKKLLGS